MRLNEPEFLDSVEAVQFPNGTDVTYTALVVQRAPNIADSPVYAVSIGNGPLNLISAVDALHLAKAVLTDINSSGYTPTIMED